MVDYCEIYITGVRQLGLGWVDSPDSFLDEISLNLSDIERFNYISLSLNMAQAFNFSSKVSDYDAMMIYLKGIRFAGKSFFTTEEMKHIESRLKLHLSYVYGLSFKDIEIRVAQKYEYEEIGG